MSYGATSEQRAMEHFDTDGYVDPYTYPPTGLPYTDRRTPVPAPTTVLDEAKQLVYGDREAAYSHPYDDFTRIAAVWSGYLYPELRRPLTPQDVAQMMLLLKACRVRVDVLHGRQPRHDTIVDEAGYAECASRIVERELTKEQLKIVK